MISAGSCDIEYPNFSNDAEIQFWQEYIIF